MAKVNQQPNDPDHLKRMQDGRSGKLWRIEVLYYYDLYNTSGEQISSELKRLEICNRYFDEVKEFRLSIYEIGVMLPIDPGHWVVISPADIKRIDVYRQNGYL